MEHKFKPLDNVKVNYAGVERAGTINFWSDKLNKYVVTVVGFGEVKYFDEDELTLVPGGGGDSVFTLSEDAETATATITPNTESESVRMQVQEQGLSLEGRTVSMHTYQEDSENAVTFDNYVGAGEMTAYIGTSVESQEGALDTLVMTGGGGAQLATEFYCDEYNSTSSVTVSALDSRMQVAGESTGLETGAGQSTSVDVFASIAEGAGLTYYVRTTDGDDHTFENTSGICVTPSFSEEEPSVIQLKNETWVQSESGGEYIGGEGSIRVTGVATPIDDNDAVNKNYVDSQGFLTLDTLPIYDGSVSGGGSK